MILVVNNQLIFPLLGISELHHTYSSLSAIEMVEEFAFHLVPTVNELGFKVCVPIKGIPSNGLNKSFNKYITPCSCIVARFDEWGNMLLQIFFSIKLLKLQILITHKHM